MLDELLAKKGLKYGDLTPDERAYATSLVSSIQSNALSIDKARDAIHGMKEAVERELVVTDEFCYFLFFKWVNRKCIYLKARLQNYLLIEILLSTPDKLKAQLDASLSNIVSPVG
jgi:hypothetical protein